MDKFVTRAPTWKTMNYASISSGYGRSSSGKKATPKSESSSTGAKKPLGVLQESAPKNKDAAGSRRLSIRDDRLLKIFTSQPDQPLIETNTSDSGCSSSSESFNCVGRPRQLADDENIPPVFEENHLNFDDPLDNIHSATSQHSDGIVVPERPSTPQNVMLSSDSPAPCTPKDNPMLMRIQRDLNSPSASVRVRAMKALKSPTRSAYAQFDVPHDEQSIITEEDRRTPEPPKTIQELMENIIVYVEVRTGEDNRSAGVKKVISALGAKVNDKLLRDTTHVIFKDGLLSTYKKAKNWNIPVVSILWIEACKNKCKICDPNEFPISNIDRYENPELYDKMKRHKSMQPDSEANKRVRVKAATPKDSTPKKGALKKTSTLIDGTPLSASNKKTDISRFFKQLGSNQKPQTPRAGFDPREVPLTPVNSSVAVSPATQLLNRINNNCFTPISKSDNILPEKESNECAISAACSTKTLQEIKKPLTYSPQEKSPTSSKRVSTRRRSTIHMTASIEATANSMEEMSISPCKKPPTPSKTPRKTPRRRSSIHVTTTMNFTKEKDLLKSTEKTKNFFASIAEEETTISQTKTTTEKKRSSVRKTMFSTKTMEISELSEDISEAPARATSRGRRSTMCIEQNIQQSASNDKLEKISSSSKEQPCTSSVRAVSSDTQLESNKTFAPLTPIPSNVASSTRLHHETLIDSKTPQPVASLLEEHSKTPIFSSTRKPGRRTLFDVSMDIISQRLQNINQSSRRSIAAPCTIDSEVRRNSLEKETPTLRDSPAAIQSVSTPSLPSQETTRKLFHEATIEQKTSCMEQTSTDKATENGTVPKKRKLFMPNESIFLTQSPTGASASLVGKRRRSLMPPAPQPLEIKVPTTVAAVTKAKRAPRRSTMDFEAMEKAKSSLAGVKKLSGSKTSSIASQESLSDASVKQGPTLVYTNMHSEQIELIKEAVAKLGRFQLEEKVGEETTHVVSLEPRRTLNLLRALVRGLWILEFTWIEESLRAGKWLSEEQYELRDFSRAVEICRSERQAFGCSYRSELFSGLGSFYISSRCGPIPKEHIIELIELCGGKTVEQRKRAKYILGDANKALEEKIYITPYWILDSITHMQLQKLSKYSTASDVARLNPTTATSQ